MAKYVRKNNVKYNRNIVMQFSMNDIFIREWKTVGEIYRELGFDKSAILRCCKGKQKKSYWFIWRFKDDLIKPLNINSNENNSPVSA